MRDVELVISPGPAGFHPADRALVESPDVERVAIHHFNQLDDGTVVLLYQIRGDRAYAQSVIDEHPDVLASSIAADDEDLYAYVHIRPNDTVATVFELPQEHGIVVDTPIACLPDGSLRVSVLADQETLTDALAPVPDAIDVELETMREYDPAERDLFATLTPRQQELLRTAIAVGYYDVPRAATYEDVAAELDLAPVTVGEHLRKIEARILTAVAPDGTGTQ